jgi:dolichol-phosphate mannosyltransferase
MDVKVNTPTLVGVVIPTYLEGNNIASLILKIRELHPGFLIAIVDDSPTLETVNCVKNLKLENIDIIHRDKKDGRGSAVIKGISILLNRGCHYIIEMDADFSHPPTQISELLEFSSKNGLDLLIAGRYSPSSKILNWPFTRRIFSTVSNWLAFTLLRVPVNDYTNGFRVYSKGAAQLITETCGKLGKGFISLSEILVNVYYRGLKVGEVPTIFTNRVRGESSVNYKEVTNALAGLFKILRLKNKLVRTAVRLPDIKAQDV